MVECAVDGSQQCIDRQQRAQPRLCTGRGARRLTRRNAYQKDGKVDRHGGNRHIPIQPGKTQIHKYTPEIATSDVWLSAEC